MSDVKSKKKSRAVKKAVVRYSKNPFAENMEVPTKKSSVKLSRLGKDDHVLMNQDTGEVQGTHVATWRTVDAEEFVKLFTQNVALTFGLTSPGIKAFNVLVWVIQYHAIEKDKIILDKYIVDDFLEAHKSRKPPLALSLATFGRGLSELEDAKIIAKAMRPGDYFINPNFAFNGDRIAFTTVIEKAKKEDQQEGDAHLQTDAFLEKK